MARLEGDGDRFRLVQRAAVGHPVPEFGEHPGEAGGPERLRAHQRAAGGRAKLEAGAEDGDVAPVMRGEPLGLKGVEQEFSVRLHAGRAASTNLVEAGAGE